MNAKQLSARARALAEIGRKHMRPLAIQGVSGLSFDRLIELAETMAQPAAPQIDGPSPALAAALDGVRAWIEQIQRAIAREFPKSMAVEEEFGIDKKLPSDPEKMLATALVVFKAAGMYSVNLLNRGVDAARVRHIEILDRNVRLAIEAEAKRPDPAAAQREARTLIAQIEQAAREAFKEDRTTLATFALGEDAAEAAAPEAAASAPAAAAVTAAPKKRGGGKKAKASA